MLYRDKHCICAACESVWLALEVKCVDYVTVLVENCEEEQLPRIVWDNSNNSHDDTSLTITDPVKLIEQIQSRYPDTSPQFYPKLSSAVDASRCNILRLPGVMPRNSDTTLMSLSPYLFRNDGTLVKPSSHAVSLEEVEEMQEEYYLGDFLCGKEITGADIIWAPYLERYAIQLPIVYPNKSRLNPRNRNMYDEVDKWYRVMEREVLAYSCRVMGDARHWRKCLEVAIQIHNERVGVNDNDEERVYLPDISLEESSNNGWWMKKNSIDNAGEIWKEYSSQRPWHAPTPGGEVALFLMRNRKMIVNEAASDDSLSDFVSYSDYFDQDTADEALREVIQLLLDWDVYFDQSSEDEVTQPLSDLGRKMALFVAEEMIQVPRDMGMIPASVLWEVIWSFDDEAAEEETKSDVGKQQEVGVTAVDVPSWW